MKIKGPLYTSILLLGFGVAVYPQETTGTLRAQFVNAVNGFGLPNIRVHFDRLPADGQIEADAITDPLGMITLELEAGSYQPKVVVPTLPSDALNPLTITAGGTTHVRYRLTIPDLPPDEFFNLMFQVKCVVSQTVLPNSEIMVKRWPSADTSGAAQTRTLRSNGLGVAQLPGMEKGYFQFEVSKAGWETYQFPTNGPVLLEGAHGILAALKPLGTNLSITVVGKNPAATDFRDASPPLTNVLVEVIGLSFDDPPLETIPAKQGYTDENGNITFRRLPSVPWRIEVKKNGYEPYMAVVQPNEDDGGLPPQTVSLRLHETTAIVARFLTSDTNFQAQINGATVSSDGYVAGLSGSESDGIKREGGGRFGFGGLAFDHLLPGRYVVGVRSATAGTPIVRFGAASAIVDVADEEVREIELHLDPIPATVSGRILVFEQSKLDFITFNEESFRTRASARVEFREVMPNGTVATEPKVVQTDSNGAFSVQLKPGNYRVQIPDLPGYSEKWWDIRANDAYAGQAPANNPDRTPWPSAPGYPFRSGYNYEVDLVIARNAVNVEANLLAGSPFEAFTYEDYFSNAGVLIHFLDLEKTQFQLKGPVERTAVWERELPAGVGYVIFTNMPSGTYELSGGPTQFYDFSNIDQTSPTVRVTIPEWSSYPGAFDGAASPLPAGGSFRMSDQLLGIFKYPMTNAPVLEVRTWIQSEQRYSDLAQRYTNWVHAFSLPDYPDIVWRANRFKIAGASVPSMPGFNMHTMILGGWRTFSYTPGVDTITAFSGGPQDPGPGNFQGSQVSFRFRTFLKGGEEIEGIRWTRDGQELVSGGGFTKLPLQLVFGSFSGNPFQGMIEVPFRVIRSSIELLDGNPFTAEAFVMIVRDMELSGAVRDQSGLALTNVSVRVYDQLNNLVLSDVRTDATGNFRAALQARGDPVFVEVVERGYKPVKRFLRPADKTADLTGVQINLEPLPAPRIDEITFNRFGLFLPGVSKSGDFTGFNADIARDTLMAKWGVMAQAQSFSYTVDELSGTTVSPKSVQASDEVQEIWFVDRKGYTNSAALATPQFPNLFSGVQTNSFRSVAALLSEIESGTRSSGMPLVAVHRKVRVDAPPSDNSYSGRLFVPDLPPGFFEPYVVVITKRGAVGVQAYQYPSDALKLEGWMAPPWLDKGILNTIGMLNTFRVKGDDLRSSITAYFPKGSFLPLPDFSSRITFVPQTPADSATAGAEAPGFIKYSYSVGVKSKLGVDTPKSGSVLALGSPKIGVEMGGSVGISALGKEKEIEISFSGFLNNEFVTTNLLDRPALTVGQRFLKRIGSVKLRAEGSDSLKFKAKVGDVGERLVLTQAQRGFYEVEVVFDLFEKTIVVSIPYAGVVLLALDSLDLQLPVKLLLGTKFGGGTENIYTWETVQPRPFNVGSTVSGQPTRLHFLGSEGTRTPVPPDPGSGWDFIRPSSRTDILFLVGASLKAVIGKDSGIGLGGYGAGIIELSSPLQAPDRGVRVKLNPGAEGAPLLEVVGAINGGFDWKVNFIGLQYSAQHRWQLLPIQWKFGTEPYHAIYPLPTVRVTTPASAVAAAWVGGDGTLLNGFYEAGTFDYSSGNRPALVFTQTDPTDGSMDLMVSVRTANGFSAPVRVAESGGILSAAIAQMPSAIAPSGWMVVWSEIDSADLGNPMAESTIKYSIAADAAGGTWNAPRELARTQTPAVKLDLQGTANRLFLFWMEPETSLLSERREIKTANYRITGWSAPAVAFRADQNLVDYRFTTSEQFTDFRLAIATQHRDGWIFGAENNDGRWGTFEQIAERHSILPSIFYDSTGALWRAAHAASNVRIVVSRLDNNGWVEVNRIDGRPDVESLTGGAIKDGDSERVIVSWTAEGIPSEIWHAWISRTGETLAAPRSETISDPGSIGNVFLSQTSGQSGDATVIYHLFDTGSSSLRTMTLSSEQTVALQFSYEPDDRQIRISWPASAPGFVLEQTNDLISPINWQTVGGVQSANGENYVLLQPSDRQQFFRLRRD